VSKLLTALERLKGRGDRARLGTVEAYLGDGRYRVSIQGVSYDVAAVAQVQAAVGQSVALLVSGETGAPFALLGPVSPEVAT
jgi:hypothetical protein